MSIEYTPGSNIAAETLVFLADQVQMPELIDDTMGAAPIKSGELIMTSMGNRRRAVITPYYPALPYENSFTDRYQRAINYDRPLVEAKLGLNTQEGISMANLVLRLCDQSDYSCMIESAWQFPLEDTPTGTMEDVIDAVKVHARKGRAVKNRSGLVSITDERLRSTNRNWAISRVVDPEAVIRGLYAQTVKLGYILLN